MGLLLLCVVVIFALVGLVFFFKSKYEREAASCDLFQTDVLNTKADRFHLESQLKEVRKEKEQNQILINAQVRSIETLKFILDARTSAELSCSKTIGK